MPGPGEPLWTAEDFEYAVAWQAELDSRCPGCGHHVDEAWNRDNHNAYEGSTHRCYACMAAARASRSMDSEIRDGVYVTAHLDHRPSE